jgi:hypothetical protein
MPDLDPEDQAEQLLADAERHLAQARGFLDARAPGDRRAAYEEAALLVALAQAEATLSIAGQLAGGLKLSRPANDAVKELGGGVYLLRQAVNALKRQAGG